MINVIPTQENEQEKKSFPKLMRLKHAGGLFLFFSEKECFYIDGKDLQMWSTGEHASGINVSEFVDYNEPVTIQNI
jgi:hypothetical protein